MKLSHIVLPLAGVFALAACDNSDTANNMANDANYMDNQADVWSNDVANFGNDVANAADNAWDATKEGARETGDAVEDAVPDNN